MAEHGTHFYEFGRFRLDASERVLWRDQEPVPLTPKVFDILLALVARSGHVVEKDDLMRRVWPDTFVEEGNLTQSVSLLRKALGETPAGPQFIETISRRGYRFVADVREGPDSEYKSRSDALEPVERVSNSDDSIISAVTSVGPIENERSAAQGRNVPRSSVLITRWVALRSHVPALVAGIYAGLNDRDQSFKWLEKAFEERDIWLMNLKVDPVFSKLRSDRRFPDLLLRTGLRP